MQGESRQPDNHDERRARRDRSGLSGGTARFRKTSTGSGDKMSGKASGQRQRSAAPSRRKPTKRGGSQSRADETREQRTSRANDPQSTHPNGWPPRSSKVADVERAASRSAERTSRQSGSRSTASSLAQALNISRGSAGRIAVAVAVVLLVVVLAVFCMPKVVFFCPGEPRQTVQEGDVAVQLLNKGRVTNPLGQRVTFAAVGDNIATDDVLALADGYAGKTGDDQYDFTPFFSEFKRLLAEDNAYDIAFINQETVLGDTEANGVQGYPSFNTPATMADAIADAGFRVVSTNSNHTYDWGLDAAAHSQQVWGRFSQLLTVGSYATQEDRDTVRVVECNGLRISFLAYSYGQNGYEPEELPNSYVAVKYDEATIAADVQRAKQVSDVVVVYMHWGTEFTSEIDDDQKHFAQVCADNGVGLVVGSHTHTIQPLAWIDRAGDGRMLCAYGLGDFLSAYADRPTTVLSGMLSCAFVRGDDGEVTVEDVLWHPVIEHREGNEDRVYLLSDYNEKLANKNDLLRTLDKPYDWCRDTSSTIIGSDFTLDL